MKKKTEAMEDIVSRTKVRQVTVDQRRKQEQLKQQCWEDAKKWEQKKCPESSLINDLWLSMHKPQRGKEM